MDTIYDPLPAEVLENLEILCADLDEKIPSKELDRNLLIATWNIRGFGNLTISSLIRMNTYIVVL